MDLKVRNVNLSFDLNLVWLNKLSVTLNITPRVWHTGDEKIQKSEMC